MPDIYSMNKEYALAQTGATHYNTQLEFTSKDSAIKSVGCLKRLGARALEHIKRLSPRLLYNFPRGINLLSIYKYL